MSTTPTNIGLLEHRFTTRNGLPIQCFLIHQESAQQPLRLLHAMACGFDIIEILRPEVIKQIEIEAQACKDAGHEIATFFNPQEAHEFCRFHGDAPMGWLA